MGEARRRKLLGVPNSHDGNAWRAERAAIDQAKDRRVLVKSAMLQGRRDQKKELARRNERLVQKTEYHRRSV